MNLKFLGFREIGPILSQIWKNKTITWPQSIPDVQLHSGPDPLLWLHMGGEERNREEPSNASGSENRSQCASGGRDKELSTIWSEGDWVGD